jgi:WD40 repeat protein
LTRCTVSGLFFVGLFGVLGTHAAFGEDWSAYSIAPIPRIEISMHSEEIRALAVSGDGKYILTASVDKTARLWRANDGHLERIIRLPFDGGHDQVRTHEGKLYAAAFSPDGRWALLAGYTIASYAKKAPFFFFAVDLRATDAAGAPQLRYGGVADLPTAVQTMAMSSDGSFIAVCLTGSAGLLVFDWSTVLEGKPKAMARDVLEADDACYGVDFSPQNDLAISTRRGAIRLYRHQTNFSKPEVIVTGIPRPKHPRFSPDGNSLAFGSDTSPQFGLIDLRTSSDRRVLVRHADKDANIRGFFSVEWSGIGEFVVVGGETRDTKQGVLYRYGQQGRGGEERLSTSARRIDDMRRLPDGSVAFVGAAPEIGVVDRGGKMRWRQRADTIALSPDRAELRVSEDGSEILFKASDDVSSWLAFDTRATPDGSLRMVGAPEPRFPMPQRQSTKVHFEVTDDREGVSVNDKRVALLPEERVLDHLVSSNPTVSYIGTSWFIRQVDATGQSRWAAAVSAEVDAIALSKDETLIVAALTDGTIRWFRTDDGVEVFALLALRNGTDWVGWIPSGYYVSSPAGDNFIGWHINRPLGPGQYDVDFYRAVQFDRVLYRPDIVRSFLSARGSRSVDRIVNESAAFDVAHLNDIAPPDMSIAVVGQRVEAGTRVALLQLSGTARKLAMEDWTLFVNGIPLTPTADRRLSGAEQLAFQRPVTIPIGSGHTDLRLESFNGRSLGIAEYSIDGAESRSARPGTLFLAAIGVSAYDDKRVPSLRYAARDATDMTALYSRLGSGFFRGVKTMLIADGAGIEPTSENIAHLTDFFSAARGEDTVVLFLAAHGISDSAGNYYMLPKEAEMSDVQKILHDRPGGQSLVSWRFFFDLLRNTAGRRLLIVDTCSSGNIGGTFDAHSLAKRSLSSSFALMTAAKGSEESQETDVVGHGIFTYGLLDALQRGPTSDRTGYLSLSEAFMRVTHEVEALRNPRAGPQTPQLVAPPPLIDMAIVGAATPH